MSQAMNNELAMQDELEFLQQRTPSRYQNQKEYRQNTLRIIMKYGGNVQGNVTKG